MCQRKEKLLRNFHVPKKGKTTDKMSWVKKSENKKKGILLIKCHASEMYIQKDKADGNVSCVK